MFTGTCRRFGPPLPRSRQRRVDAIVVCGDTAAGPLVRGSLEMLVARPEPVYWVSGNGERETVACFDQGDSVDVASDWAPWTVAGDRPRLA